MRSGPWTDPDPQPGDLDAELELLDESVVEYHEADLLRNADRPAA